MSSTFAAPCVFCTFHHLSIAQFNSLPHSTLAGDVAPTTTRGTTRHDTDSHLIAFNSEISSDGRCRTSNRCLLPAAVASTSTSLPSPSRKTRVALSEMRSLDCTPYENRLQKYGWKSCDAGDDGDDKATTARSLRRQTNERTNERVHCAHFCWCLHSPLSPVCVCVSSCRCVASSAVECVDEDADDDAINMFMCGARDAPPGRDESGVSDGTRRFACVLVVRASARGGARKRQQIVNGMCKLPRDCRGRPQSMCVFVLWNV